MLVSALSDEYKWFKVTGMLIIQVLFLFYLSILRPFGSSIDNFLEIVNTFMTNLALVIICLMEKLDNFERINDIYLYLIPSTLLFNCITTLIWMTFRYISWKKSVKTELKESGKISPETYSHEILVMKVHTLKLGNDNKSHAEYYYGDNGSLSTGRSRMNSFNSTENSTPRKIQMSPNSTKIKVKKSHFFPKPLESE